MNLPFYIDARDEVSKLTDELFALKKEFKEFKDFVEFELKQARRHSYNDKIHQEIIIKKANSFGPDGFRQGGS